MAGAPNERSTKKTEIGLVLQGGGALGAYEWGGIQALFKLMKDAGDAGRDVTLRAVTGVSIGAINAACIVGADEDKGPLARLETLWNDFMIKAPAFVPAAVTLNLALLEVLRFYRFSPAWNWTSLYDTHELLKTLSDHVSFDALNKSDTTFVVTAVDVETADLMRFSNKKLGKLHPTTIKPEHILASGSLAPQFPWTKTSQGSQSHYYWDGGLVDNTPLGDAIEAFTPGDDVTRLLVVMNLFPILAKRPDTFAQVNDRINQLRFGNRLSQDTRNAERLNDLLCTIEKLIPHAPSKLQDEAQRALDKLKRVTPIEIMLSADTDYSDEDGFRDFSQQGIERRRKAGHQIALEKLRKYF